MSMKKARALGINHVVLEVGDLDEALEFYGRLFELDPSVRALFKNDMKDQGRKLMAMLKVAALLGYLATQP